MKTHLISNQDKSQEAAQTFCGLQLRYILSAYWVNARGGDFEIATTLDMGECTCLTCIKTAKADPDKL